MDVLALGRQQGVAHVGAQLVQVLYQQHALVRSALLPKQARWLDVEIEGLRNQVRRSEADRKREYQIAVGRRQARRIGADPMQAVHTVGRKRREPSRPAS